MDGEKQQPETAGEKQQRETDLFISLPMDVWVDILLRIPVQDLFRCKFVCKAWHELISSQQFVYRHLEHGASVDGLLLNMEYSLWFHRRKVDIYFSDLDTMGRDKPLFRSPLPISDGYTCQSCNLPINRCLGEAAGSKDLRVLASCDGLLLICYVEEQACYQLLVCNPVTGSYRSLPLPTCIHDFHAHAISEICEWVIARNASTGQYKIFGMGKWHSTDRKCYIFDLQPQGCCEEQWKELSVPLLSDTWSIQASTTKGSKVYWLAESRVETILLSIDISEEEFSLSTPVRSCHRAGRYFASRGRFYCIEQKSSSRLTLSALENLDAMKWSVWWNIFPLPHIFRYACMEHVAMLGDSKFVVCFENKMSLFDMISKKFTSVGLHSKNLSFWRARKVVPHTWRARKVVPHTSSLVPVGWI